MYWSAPTVYNPPARTEACPRNVASTRSPGCCHTLTATCAMVAPQVGQTQRFSALPSSNLSMSHISEIDAPSRISNSPEALTFSMSARVVSASRLRPVNALRSWHGCTCTTRSAGAADLSGKRGADCVTHPDVKRARGSQTANPVLRVGCFAVWTPTGLGARAAAADSSHTTRLPSRSCGPVLLYPAAKDRLLETSHSIDIGHRRISKAIRQATRFSRVKSSLTVPVHLLVLGADDLGEIAGGSSLRPSLDAGVPLTEIASAGRAGIASGS